MVNNKIDFISIIERKGHRDMEGQRQIQSRLCVCVYIYIYVYTHTHTENEL